MRATIRDVGNSLTLRNCIAFGAIVLLSVVLIDVLGYFVWRRFPIPALIIFVAVLGWKVGKRIGHAGLSRILNAASVGLGVFGGATLAAALIDGYFFPTIGYVTWGAHMTMWAWIGFHFNRAWRILKNMPSDRLIHVTEGTEAIYAQMTYREAQGREALEEYKKARKKLAIV